MELKENQIVEFKQNWKDEYLQYISGFANAQGGTLYIGVDDNGNICGVKNAAALLEKFLIKSIAQLVFLQKSIC